MLNKNEIIYTVQTLLQQYPYVLKAELFGSQQREEAGANSDVDLIVNFDPITRPKGVALYAVEQALEDALGMSVEVVRDQYLRDSVRQGIGEDRELIYEKVL
ncbi:MAG: nucleotidyltransferase domain-containing protein [Desulfovibrio sp.]|nr:nucleotidyltransferase domain-containing protein [Desulfovibrio sp.]